MRTSVTYLQKYANQIREKYYPNVPHIIVGNGKRESRFAGRAIGSYKITIQRWMLADKNEAKSTIRHELAHNIVSYLGLPHLISHGKEFHQILRQIAPKAWRQDLYWKNTPAISQAREKSGIKPIKRQPMTWRYFTCGNSNCPTIPNHKWAYKRIPSYIQRGLFARCKDCGCPEIMEIGGKHEIFKSVH